MKSGMPGAADITPPLPGKINNFSRIRIQIALPQDAVHTAIDTPSTEKAPGAFIQERAQRLSMRHNYRLRRDIAQDELNDGPGTIVQQGDTLFQVEAPVPIVTLDPQLSASQGWLCQRDDTVVACIAWVRGQGVTLLRSDTGRGRQHERTG
jgi:hypothetical protein